MSHYFLALLIVSASFGSLGCYFQPKITELDSQELNEINEEFPIDGFGYSSDIGILERGQVQANESLYVLLNEMGISQQIIRQVSNEQRFVLRRRMEQTAPA